MTLEQLIKLAQSKDQCITIWCWDDDIGYVITLDPSGCGDDYMARYYNGMSIKEVVTKAERFLRRIK